MRAFGFIVLVLLPFGCGTGNQAAEGGSTDAVETAASAHFEVARTDPLVEATGALHVVQGLVGTIETRLTCGITFVTETLAVTAAHCTDGIRDLNAPLDVRSYDVMRVSDEALVRATKIDLTWARFPGWEHHALNVADGYRESAVSGCKLVARWPDIGQSPEQAEDVALIACEGRTGPFVNVADESFDSWTGPVENLWFHEVYDPGLLRADHAADWQAHYVDYPTRELHLNYHYLGRSTRTGEEFNQLLPLRARDFADGTQRRVVRLEDERMWSDIYSCHGTSGSGVFARRGREHVYLGPVASGSTAIEGRLCSRPELVKPGESITAFVGPRYVRKVIEANRAR